MKMLKNNWVRSLMTEIAFQLGKACGKVFPRENERWDRLFQHKQKENNRSQFLFWVDKLQLDLKDAEDFSTESIREIILHQRKLLQQTFAIGIATIFLVVGFAASTMLTQGIGTNFPYIRVIDPYLGSSLVGSPWSGHIKSRPQTPKERRSNCTCGLRVFDIHVYDPTIHDEKYKFEKYEESDTVKFSAN